MQSPEMSLLLSSDAKPRLKWTPELHSLFVRAVAHLGGADKATPKALVRAMGIPGLTLYHLKSHLQKHRLGKKQQSVPCRDHKQEEVEDNRSEYNGAHCQINESLQITQALHLQMEVQKKLREQFEVQRHLELRIEAQGKYLQSVLKQAQAKLVGSSATETGAHRTELPPPMAVSHAGCPDSPFSDITGIAGSIFLKDIKETTSAMESSLTTSGSSGWNGDSQGTGFPTFMETPPGKRRKTTNSTVSDGSCWEPQPSQCGGSGSHLGSIEGGAGIAVGRVGAVVVIGPEAVDSEVRRRFSGGRVAAALLRVAIRPWPLPFHAPPSVQSKTKPKPNPNPNRTTDLLHEVEEIEVLGRKAGHGQADAHQEPDAPPGPHLRLRTASAVIRWLAPFYMESLETDR